MAEIIGTCGTVFLCDDEDHELLSKYKWSRYCEKYPYAVSSKNDRMHRLVLGAQKGQIVDHINGDRTDNRRSNLRFASKEGNAQNAAKRSDNKSGHKGVSWDYKSKLWEVRVKVNGRQRFGGRFSDLNEAAERARSFRLLFHGEFASDLRPKE
jgi:hypothetical protein